VEVVLCPDKERNRALIYVIQKRPGSVTFRSPGSSTRAETEYCASERRAS
jgi:hypothetical protein